MRFNSFHAFHFTSTPCNETKRKGNEHQPPACPLAPLAAFGLQPAASRAITRCLLYFPARPPLAVVCRRRNPAVAGTRPGPPLPRDGFPAAAGRSHGIPATRGAGR